MPPKPSVSKQGLAGKQSGRKPSSTEPSPKMADKSDSQTRKSSKASASQGSSEGLIRPAGTKRADVSEADFMMSGARQDSMESAVTMGAVQQESRSASRRTGSSNSIKPASRTGSFVTRRSESPESFYAKIQQSPDSLNKQYFQLLQLSSDLVARYGVAGTIGTGTGLDAPLEQVYKHYDDLDGVRKGILKDFAEGKKGMTPLANHEAVFAKGESIDTYLWSSMLSLVKVELEELETAAVGAHNRVNMSYSPPGSYASRSSQHTGSLRTRDSGSESSHRSVTQPSGPGSTWSYDDAHALSELAKDLKEPMDPTAFRPVRPLRSGNVTPTEDRGMSGSKTEESDIDAAMTAVEKGVSELAVADMSTEQVLQNLDRLKAERPTRRDFLYDSSGHVPKNSSKGRKY